jgi:uncharacterized protein
MLPQRPQLIPSEICLECPVCCRFPEKHAALSPFFLPEERARVETTLGGAGGGFRNEGPSRAECVPCGHGWACSFFDPKDHTCGVYAVRPLDCSIYPAAVMHSRDGQKVMLGADTKCPALGRTEIAARVVPYLNQIQRYLESPAIRDLIHRHPEFISPFQEEVSEARELSLGKA